MFTTLRICVQPGSINRIWLCSVIRFTVHTMNVEIREKLDDSGRRYFTLYIISLGTCKRSESRRIGSSLLYSPPSPNINIRGTV